MALEIITKSKGSESKDRLKKVSPETRKVRNERNFMNQMLSTAEEVEWSEMPKAKVPILAVEIVGTEGTGKTHCALTFPKAALLDTEGKACNVMRKFKNNKWFKASMFLDVIDFVNTVIKSDDIETAIFDSSRDVVDMAEQFTLEQLEKTALYSQAGAVLYTHVNQKMDWIVQTLRAHGKNIVFTSRMKDEYKQNVRTGGMQRDGYKKAPYQFDLVLELTTSFVWHDKEYILIEPIAKVVKNGYVKRGQSKPFIASAEYQTILNEIFDPIDREAYMTEFMKGLDLESEDDE